MEKEFVEPRLRRLKKKYDPNSADDFIAWLRKQPGRKRYDWYDCASCLFHDYLALGCGAETTLHGFVKMEYAAPVQGDQGAYHEIGRTMPWTFASALKRAVKWRKANPTSRTEGPAPTPLSE